MSTQTEPSLAPSLSTDRLQSIAYKLENNERLSFDDGMYLFKTPHETELYSLADWHRKRTVGDIVYYTKTLYIHPTNLCELSCPMCSFYAKPGWESAWFLKPDEIVSQVQKAYNESHIDEVHFVGGLWRDCNLDYYQESFTNIKAIDPKIHIKALTAVEYDFLAKLHNIPIEEVFLRMKSWGLGSLPGGGAEVLVEKIRKQLAPQKITSEEFIEIHKVAHKIGLPSNVTMLFGHVEEYEHLVTHFCKVREAQDETGGFTTFVPLKYHLENNALGKRANRLKSKNVRKVYAVSRLMLDNLKNLKVLWNYLGVEDALEILKTGGNDLSATQIGEKIIRMAGGVEVKMTQEVLEDLITQSGRIPKEVHSGYDYSQDYPI